MVNISGVVTVTRWLAEVVSPLPIDNPTVCLPCFYRAMLRRVQYCYGKLSFHPSICPKRWGTLIT